MKTQTISSQDIEILARTIYGEARGEYSRQKGGLTSFIAIANVVMNRLHFPRLFGRSVSDVCLKKWQFSCWNKNDPNYPLITAIKQGGDSLFDIASVTAEKVALGLWPDVTKGSNHYHAASIPDAPSWARGQQPQIRIGQHIFYKISN